MLPEFFSIFHFSAFVCCINFCTVLFWILLAILKKQFCFNHFKLLMYCTLPGRRSNFSVSQCGWYRCCVCCGAYVKSAVDHSIAFARPRCSVFCNLWLVALNHWQRIVLRLLNYAKMMECWRTLTAGNVQLMLWLQEHTLHQCDISCPQALVSE